MSIQKSPYELSAWDDRLTLVGENGEEFYDTVPEGTSIITSYFKEIKLCVFGSNTMDSLGRAQEVELKQNVNGENTLTFSMYSKYFDPIEGIFRDNPYLPFLVNERKIKLKFYKKNRIQWLDLIIKNVEESSENYKYTFTAKDLFVNELSKNGFNLIFDQELENNQGTVEQLAKVILKDTDWRVSEESEMIQQFQEEALYEIVLNEDIIATNILDGTQKLIAKGQTIYGFYSSIINQDYDFFQFIYNEDNEYKTDEKRVIYDAQSFYINIESSQEENQIWPPFASSTQFVDKYRGERIVRHQEATYDPILDKYIKIYTNEAGEEVYGYTETKYVTPQLAKSLITNGTKFTTNSGWKQNKAQSVKVVSIPSFEELPGFDISRLSTLEYTQDQDSFLFNSGFKDNYLDVSEVYKNELYCFRVKAGLRNEDLISLNTPQDTYFTIQVKSYKLNTDGTFAEDDENTEIIFNGVTEASDVLDSEGYLFGFVTSLRAVTSEELKNNNYGIFITAVNVNNIQGQTYYFQDIQFFKYLLDEKNNLCLPDGSTLDIQNMIVNKEFNAYSLEYHYFYYPGRATTKEDVVYLYVGEEPHNFYPKYSANFEKVRSITASETNRFDLLQTLSETFECWCRFEIKHKENGEILLNKDVPNYKTISAGNSTQVMADAEVYTAGTSLTNEQEFLVGADTTSDYQQQKFISFHKNIGKENYVDFVYGINLKSIQRTLESEDIISKLTVKSNNNEFAPYGGCSISRARENPIGENFIYNFDYYINQGMLNYENLSNDLYSLEQNKGWLGFYTRLKKLNQRASVLITEQGALTASYNKQNAEYQALQLQYEANVESLREKEEHFFEMTQHTYDTINTNNSWLKEKSVIALGNIIISLREENLNLQEKYLSAKVLLNDMSSKLEAINQELSEINIQKDKLINKFETKYYRFIQEGPWTSEDYMDDNLYYLDANSTLCNSSQPKVSYTINIVELSQIEGFEEYDFDLGDVTHIQDTEFFGWTFKDGIRSPYREKIVVTELVTYFDTPEQNTIKVQNYRTQFEDLFQRLSVNSQKIEFQSGAYSRAADVVSSNGEILPEALESAFSNNSTLLKNANNNSVTWDESGITTKNLLNNNEIVRVTSGGIYLTNDGGESWTTGITGQGINAKSITSGQLNTEKITILNGTQTSFRWDSLGINAYYKMDSGYYDNKTYVRFDQYGIYGVKNLNDNFAPTSEQQVWDTANFALTWKGFMLKSVGEGGSVSIDTEKDFNVLDSQGNEIIRIGRLGIDSISGEDIGYGIRIKDMNGGNIFQTSQKAAMISGWSLEENIIKSIATSYTEDGELSEKVVALYGGGGSPLISINGISREDWAMTAGENFGITYEGSLYAKNAVISGTIIANTGSIGQIPISDEGFLDIDGAISEIKVEDENELVLFDLFKGSKDEEGNWQEPPYVKIGGWAITNLGMQNEDKTLALSVEGITSGDKDQVLWSEVVDCVNWYKENQVTS